MKKFITLLILMVSLSIISFAKKDINAWKGEKTLDQQFIVFKNNLNFWNGSYFLNELQFNEFFKTVNDSIGVMEKKVLEGKGQIQILQNELNLKIIETEEIQAKLNSSIKRENSISIFGTNVSKRIYSLTMYIFILTAIAISGIVFILFKRSNNITKRIRNDYNELKEEYELHKKNSLDRYVKMNIELNKTRFELNKR